MGPYHLAYHLRTMAHVGSRSARVALASVLALGLLAPPVGARPDTVVRCVTLSGDTSDLSATAVQAAIEAGTLTVEEVADPSACADLPTPRASGTPLPDIIEPDEYDVCYLVTDAEVEAIMHRRLMFGSYGTNAGGIHDCNFFLYLDPIEMVSLTLYDDADAEGGGWALGDPVPGIGDEAYWFAGMLWVAKGGQSIAVTVVSETVDPLTAAKEVATIALSRLGGRPPDRLHPHRPTQGEGAGSGDRPRRRRPVAHPKAWSVLVRVAARDPRGVRLALPMDAGASGMGASPLREPVHPVQTTVPGGEGGGLVVGDAHGRMNLHAPRKRGLSLQDR